MLSVTFTGGQVFEVWGTEQSRFHIFLINCATLSNHWAVGKVMPALSMLSYAKIRHDLTDSPAELLHGGACGGPSLTCLIIIIIINKRTICVKWMRLAQCELMIFARLPTHQIKEGKT